MEFSRSVPLLRCSEEKAEGGRRAEKVALLEPPRQLVRPHHGPAGSPYHGPAGGPHWSRGRSGAMGLPDFHRPLNFPGAHSGILSSGRDATKGVAEDQEDGEAIEEDRQHVPQGHGSSRRSLCSPGSSHRDGVVVIRVRRRRPGVAGVQASPPP